MFKFMLWFLGAVTAAAAAAAAPATPDTLNNSLQFKNLLLQDMLASGKNIIVSPFSIEILMAIVSIAANGRTLTEIQQVFDFGTNQAAIIDYYRETLRDLVTSTVTSANADDNHDVDDDDDDYRAVTRSANRLFIQNGTQLNWQFENIVAQNFDVAVHRVDFGWAGGQTAADTINNWVRNYTFGRIDKLVSADEFDQTVRLVLVNALYFKNAWESEFDMSRTRSKPFRNLDGSISNVKMMSNVHNYLYGKNTKLDLEIVKIPYYGNSFEMVVVLPGANYSQLSHTMVFEALETTQLSYRYVDLTLPKFRIESTTNLNELLKKFGVREAFTNNANLSNLLATSDKLKIDKIVQKAFIEVGEKGTEAAAATSQILSSKIIITEAPIHFNANQSFVFIVKHRLRNVTFFIGQFLFA